MSSIWMPEGLTEQEIDLVTSIEYSRFRLNVNLKKLRNARTKVGEVKNFLRLHKSTIKNLRQSGIRIVSLKEFKALKREMGQANLLHAQVERELLDQEFAIQELKNQIVSLEKKLKKLREGGLVLEMKKYAKKR